ncbi:MAG TPA: primosomal protein N', partial [Fimbriimonadaceae bacterium]|nr:primosomal protein N' [Fimbriimonadaceae bacterium]
VQSPSQESRPARIRVADVVFDARVGGSAARYTYSLPFEVRLGELVVAPLSGRPLAGVVVRIYEVGDGDLDFPLAKLRPIANRIEDISLPAALVEMATFISGAYLCSFSSAIGPALPPGIADRIATDWTLNEPALKDSFLALTALQTEVVGMLRESIGPYQAPKSLSAALRKALKLLEAKGIALRSTRLKPIETEESERKLYRLTADEARIDAYLHEHAKKRPAQAVVLIKLREVQSGALSPEDIRALGGVTQQVVKAILDAGLLEEVESDTKLPRAAPEPNAEQRAAIEAIVSAAKKEAASGFLLFGITGSGKTEVYLRAAAEALRAGRQVLYLVPEIALATQAIGQLRDRFGSRVAVLHSELSPRERLASWMRIARGDAPIVLGARSALFAPLSNLGLIIVDEEHEASYKQESSPRYHTKSLVRFLAEMHRCPFVVGSATPSIETFYESEQGELQRLELTRRAAEARLPEVEIEDLGLGFRNGQPALLTHTLGEYLEKTVADRRQAILFLNRRAYAPFLICRECGHYFYCPKCAVTLSYSRRDLKMRCHHCGFQAAPPDACPDCQGSRISPVGVGTERVEEAVQALLPEAR